MSESVLYMSMSLDGYIAGPNDELRNPGGDEFMRLDDWYGFGADGPDPSGLQSGQKSGLGQNYLDEINATGAVLAGRRTVEQVDHWNGDHQGVPIFVPSHRPPSPSVANYPSVTYVADGIASAMAQAKAAAGDRNVSLRILRRATVPAGGSARACGEPGRVDIRAPRRTGLGASGGG